MRAVVITQTGGPEVLQVQQRPDPQPGRGEVLIDVHAAGVNFADLLARMGLYPDAPKLPAVVGYEVAGVVAALGEGVDGSIAVGQRVVAPTHFGGYAERVVAQADGVVDDSGRARLRGRRRRFRSRTQLPGKRSSGSAICDPASGSSSTPPQEASASLRRSSPSGSAPRSGAPRRRASTTRSSASASITPSTTPARDGTGRFRPLTSSSTRSAARVGGAATSSSAPAADSCATARAR